MSAVTTLAVTAAAAVGAVALFKYVDRRSRPLRAAISELRKSARGDAKGAVIDYEQDPESGVYKPKERVRR